MDDSQGARRYPRAVDGRYSSIILSKDCSVGHGCVSFIGQQEDVAIISQTDTVLRPVRIGVC